MATSRPQIDPDMFDLVLLGAVLNVLDGLQRSTFFATSSCKSVSRSTFENSFFAPNEQIFN